MVKLPERSRSESTNLAYFQEKTKRQQLLPANITLGMPQRNCQYHGICRIDLDDSAEARCPRSVRARLGYDGERLQVWFAKESLSPAAVEKHFASGYFVVLIDYTLPETLRRHFEASLVIRRGIYPVAETDTAYIVCF